MRKEMHYQFKRVIAMMLAAAMVLTSVPQAKLTVYAAENEVSEEASADADNGENENIEGEVQETEGNNEEKGVRQGGNSESDNSNQGADEGESGDENTDETGESGNEITDETGESGNETTDETGESGNETTDETGESGNEITDETGEFGDEITDEADEPAEGDRENEDEERLQAEDTEEENTNQEGKEYTFTFSADEHTTIYDESGENQIDKLTVPVGSSDTLSFKVVVEDGYVIRSVTASGKGSNKPKISGRYTTGIYRIMPQKSGYTSDAVITVRSALREDHTATITYDSSAVALYVMKGDERVSLTDGKVTASNTEYLTLKIKGKGDYDVAAVTCTTGTGDDAVTETLSYTDDGNAYRDEEGYLEYSIGRMFEDCSIKVSAGKKCTLSFRSEGASVYQLDPNDWNGSRTDVINKQICFTGIPFYFTFSADNEYNRCSWLVSTTGEESGKLTPVGSDDNGDAVYMVTPTKNMTITIKPSPKIIPFTDDSAVVERISIVLDSMGEESETQKEPVALTKDMKALEVYGDACFKIYITPKSGKLIHKVYGTYPVYESDGEGHRVQTSTAMQDYLVTKEEDGTYWANISTLDGSDNAEVDSIVITEGCEVSFNSPNAAVIGCEDGSAVDEALLAKGQPFNFRVTPAERHELLYVTAGADDSEKLELMTGEEDDEPYYQIIPWESMTVSVITAVANRKITFMKETENMDYEVTSEVQSSEGTSYYVDNEAESFSFQVSVNQGEAKPGVMLQNNRGSESELTETATSEMDGKDVYSYEVLAAELTDETTIYLYRADAPKQLTLQYNSGQLSAVSVVLEEEKLSPISSTQTDELVQEVYEVARDKTVKLSVQAADHYTSLKAAVVQGSVPSSVEATRYAYSSKLTMSVNTVLSFSAKGELTGSVLWIHDDGRETELEREGKNSRSLNYYIKKDRTYKLSMKYGNKPVRLSEVEIGRAEYSYGSFENWTDAESFLLTPEMLKSVIGSSSRSVNVSLTGTYTEQGKEKKARMSGKLVLTDDFQKEAVTVKVPGKMIADRSFSIQYTCKNRDSFSNVGAEIVPKEGIAKELFTCEERAVGKKLTVRVCVSPKVGIGEVAALKLYRKGVLPSEENYYIEGSEAKIVVTEPTELLESTPKAKVTASGDTTMTLQLDVPYDAGCVKGRQYYRIDVTPQGNQIPESIREATKEPIFVVREFPELNENGKRVGKFKQTERICVNTAGTGLGEKWSYDVKVTLVQSYDRAVELTGANAEEQTAFCSKTAELGEAETKEPRFAAKMSLKNKKTQIYTMQKNLVAASLQYDKTTTCADAVAEDITDCAKEEKLSVRVKDNQLIVSAGADTLLGKHIIELKQVGPDTLYRQGVTMDITVVKGIERLRVVLPAVSIYKQKGKAASMTASVIFNEGMEEAKTKKVTWKLVDDNGYEYDQSDITVKNGKVSVNKNLLLSDSEAEDVNTVEVRLEVTAADFEGNETTALSDKITITSVPLAMGELMIVKKNPATGLYAVTARENGTSLTTDKLKDSRLIMLRADAVAKRVYTEAEIEEYAVSAESFTAASSNAKAVAVAKAGDQFVLTAGKPAKNVKLTVTANDGSKKKKELKLTTEYAKPKALDMKITNGTTVICQPEASQSEISYQGTVNTELKLSVMQKSDDDAEWKKLSAYTNYSLTVKGGKLLSGNEEKGEYVLIVSGDAATIQLTDKGNQKQKKTYVIKNLGYSKEKAPKVKIKKGTAGSLACGAMEGRKLEYAVSAPKNYVLTDKVVRIELEASSAAKKAEDYEAFAAASEQIGEYTQAADGTLQLSFTKDNIPEGSYKLTITFGKMTDGGFLADAKPVSLTVKAAKPKAVKGSFQVTATYSKVAAAAGTKILLKCGKTPKNVHSITCTGIWNANVKGEENQFLSYFELEGSDLLGGEAYLRLRDDLTSEQLAKIEKSRTDNYGYLTYTVVHGDNGYGVPFTETKTVKITVNCKK